jgi:murein DD-endopeptidase MepM/ murein hydrolase activator NlpD
MRLLIRIVVVFCLGVPAIAAPAGARGGPVPSDAPAGPAALKAQANQLAAKYAAAQAIHARLGDQISALERQVAELEGRMAPLRDRVTRQAVAVYQGDGARDAMNSLEAAAAMLQSDRSVHLVADLTARHVPAIDALRAARQRLRDRQSELAGRRHEQDLILASLAGQREQISVELTALAAALPRTTPNRPLPRASRSASPVGQRLRPALGVPLLCPIDGPLAFSDDFGDPRSGGRRHMGNDLLSPRGTPNVAVVDGTISTRPWAGGGITIFLAGADGSTYVYMHLMQIVGAVPRRVAQGEVIGLVGNTGSAQGYHTHFEVHPAGEAAVNPYPLVAQACR